MKNRFNLLLSPVIIFTALNITACGGGGSGGGGDENPTSVTEITLGKKLFFDTNLSSDSNQSCSSCHAPAKGFADPRVSKAAPVSEGSLAGVFGNRNAPTSAYASFIPDFGLSTTATVETASKYQGGQFLDGRAVDLITQAKGPFLNPAEMNNGEGLTGRTNVVEKVRLATYASDFDTVYGASALSDVETAYTHIATAIAAFESSAEMNPFSSKFDAVRSGQATFTVSEQRGFDLFTGDVAKCANCHTVNEASGDPTIFSDFKYFNIGTPVNTDNPANIADNNFRDGGLGDSPSITLLADQTAERGKFRTPTLRNIELTAPYMHNGVYSTLQEVITHYDITLANYDGPGFGFDPEVTTNIASELNEGTFTVLGLTTQDYTDLENFMLTLTDGFM